LKLQYREARQVEYNLEHGLYEDLSPASHETIQSCFNHILFEGDAKGTIRCYKRDNTGSFRWVKRLHLHLQPVQSIYFSHACLFVKYQDGKIGIFDESGSYPSQLLDSPVQQPWHLKIIAYDGSLLLIDHFRFLHVWKRDSNGSFALYQTIENTNSFQQMNLEYLFFSKKGADQFTRNISVLKKHALNSIFEEAQPSIPISGYRSMQVASPFLFIFALQNKYNEIFNGPYETAGRDNNYNYFIHIFRQAGTYQEMQVLESAETVVFYNVLHKELFLYSTTRSVCVYKESREGTFSLAQNLGKDHTIVYFQEQSDFLITQFKEEKIHIWKRNSEGIYQECGVESPKELPLISLDLGEEGSLPKNSSQILNHYSLEDPYLTVTSSCSSPEGTRLQVWKRVGNNFRKIQSIFLACGSTIHLRQGGNLILGGAESSDYLTARACRVMNLAASPLHVLEDIAELFGLNPDVDTPRYKELRERFLRLPQQLLDQFAQQENVEIRNTEEEAFFTRNGALCEHEDTCEIFLNYLRNLKKPASGTLSSQP